MHNISAKNYNFDFPNVRFAPSETPWNLNIFLYKGGSIANIRNAAELIRSGQLGHPFIDRIELVSAIYAELSSDLAGGGSRASAEMKIRSFRLLFSFADKTDSNLTLDSLVQVYCAWADSLFIRTCTHPRTKIAGSSNDPLSMTSAYSYAATIGPVIDKVLKRQSRVIELTKLSTQRKRKSSTTGLADKQNLENTTAFGHLIADICDALELHIVLEAPFPIRIKLRSEKSFWRDARGELNSVDYPKLSGRIPLVNLRIEAEMFMFIAQTGMNLTQALNLKIYHFTYESFLDGYRVKEYKARKGGECLFEIFEEYRRHFERYLVWRKAIFLSSSELLFPFIAVGTTRQARRFSNTRIRTVCEEISIVYIPPRDLRNTRINWLLRKSADPELTAEMAQHTKATLLTKYERPSLQRAQVEATRFWATMDASNPKTEAVAPGDCTGVAKAVEEIPAGAPSPDCVKASGCLWCVNHRDIDSPDHIWALSSFKRLKAIELSKASSPLVDHGIPPAHLVIQRINEKLRWFEQSSKLRKEWVLAAETLIAEHEYHPSFYIEILELEGGQ